MTRVSPRVAHHWTMSLFFYNLLLSLCALPVFPVAVLVLTLRSRYRLGLAQRLGFLPPEITERLAGRSPFWLHGPSVGEILATRPFLQALKRDFPHSPILLSVLTPTAYVTAQSRLPEADAVIYFPVDYPPVVARVVNQLRPAAFFFTETEIWPNVLSTLAHREIPTFLVSGRFSARALARYRLLRWVLRPVFQNLTLCCMQTHSDAERLVTAGVAAQRVCVTGNFKVDGLIHGSQQGKAILQDAGLGHRPVFVAASTHPGEEEILLQAYKKLREQVPALLLLLAPRHPQRFAEVERLLNTGRYRYVKRSQTADEQVESPEVFLLDTLGELSSLYSSATVAFVGGSLIKGPGGHSVIEPALAQVPVCFGPHTRNFATVVEELARSGGGQEIYDDQSIYEWALPLLTNSNTRQEAGRHAYEVVKQGQGAVERTINAVRPCLQQSSQPPAVSNHP